MQHLYFGTEIMYSNLRTNIFLNNTFMKQSYMYQEIYVVISFASVQTQVVALYFFENSQLLFLFQLLKNPITLTIDIN